MIVTKIYIENLREKSFLNVSKEVEQLILDKFGKDPEPDDEGCRHVYTEQDIWEQVRKILRDN